MKRSKSIVASVILASIGWLQAAIAQVVSDNTVGTTVNAAGNIFTITNGILSNNNLFHPFSFPPKSQTLNLQSPETTLNLQSLETKIPLGGRLQFFDQGGKVYTVDNTPILRPEIHVMDVSRQMIDLCGTSQTSSFIITGRGGIPQHPLQRLKGNRTWHDLRPITASNPAIVYPIDGYNPAQPIVEASAIEVDETGSIALVAPQSISSNPATCASSMTTP